MREPARGTSAQVMTSSTMPRSGGASSAISYAVRTASTAAAADASSCACTSARSSPSSTGRRAWRNRARRLRDRSCPSSSAGRRPARVRRRRPRGHPVVPPLRRARRAPGAAPAPAGARADSGRHPARGSSARRPRARSRPPQPPRHDDGLRDVDPEVGVGEQAGAGVEHELGEVGGPVAAHRVERLADLERVPDRAAERLIHVGQEAGDLFAGLAAEFQHRLREHARLVERLHERAVADLDVEHDRLARRRRASST